MTNPDGKINLEELLSPGIIKNPSRFLELLEYFDSTLPTRNTALTIKNALGVHKDPILAFLLKKSFRLAAFKLKGAEFKVSLSGLEKLLHSPDRLDDLALAISSINKTEAFLASDYFKSANWKYFPNEILPVFCMFFKNYGNSLDVDDLIELTRNPNPIVIAAAVEALKKLDSGSLRSIIAPLVQNTTESKTSEAIEQVYISNANYNSSSFHNVSRAYFNENHELIIDRLKNSDSELELTRIIRLIKKYGNSDDAEFVKPFLNKEMPNVIRATIKVLEKFDSDYLSIYLPKLLQHNNNKVKLSAARALKNIDKESVENMALNNLKSLNVKMREMGITLAMLVDFEKVRDCFLSAFSKETSSDLLEKMGLVFVANPDRYLVKDLYFAHRTSKTLLKKQREDIIELVSEKVSFAFGGQPWPKELLLEAKQAYEEYEKTGSNQQSVSSNNQNNQDKLQVSKVIKPSKDVSKQDKNNSELNGIYSAINEYKDNNPIKDKLSILSGLNSKAKMIVIFAIVGALLWGLVIAVLISKLF